MRAKKDILPKNIRDIYPEMTGYLKHIRELCGGDNGFALRYLDDPMFSVLVDIHETATRAVLTHYKLECGQVMVPVIDVPLEDLLKRYISTLKSQIGSMSNVG